MKITLYKTESTPSTWASINSLLRSQRQTTYGYKANVKYKGDSSPKVVKNQFRLWLCSMLKKLPCSISHSIDSLLKWPWDSLLWGLTHSLSLRSTSQITFIYTHIHSYLIHICSQYFLKSIMIITKPSFFFSIHLGHKVFFNKYLLAILSIYLPQSHSVYQAQWWESCIS